MRLRQRAAGTTKLDTGESAIFREWQEMVEKEAKTLSRKPQKMIGEEPGSLPQPSPRRQKPKAVKRPHARFFASRH
ncbi:hypothetical protein HYW94_02355 [Candidatus Uhrbacteria bacterium]|nr:hypothetical protein [Candidatus Uhrbacteria bacterium]